MEDKDLSLLIRMKSEKTTSTTQNHKLNTESLFIPGDEVGDARDTCVIPLFKHNLPGLQDPYVIGNVFF